MSVENGTKITAPVNIQDVSRMLGEVALDVGALCTSDKICKYSRFKPYAFGNMLPLTDAQRKSANYGMTPKFIKIITAPTDDMGIAPWEQWIKPSEDGWKRLSDFNGYTHNAKKSVTSVNIHSTAGEQYTTPIYSDGTAREEGLIGEVGIENVPGLRFEDFTISNQNIGDMYLTIVLMSQDAGGVGIWVAQSDMPMREYANETARVYMWTTRINRDALRQLGSNFIILGLYKKLTINDDYTVNADGPVFSPGEIASLDMWADSLQQMVFNEETVQAGSGGAGGEAVILYVDFYGRFNYSPPLSFSVTPYSDGGALLQVGSRTANLVTWTSITDNHELPESVNLYIDTKLTAENGNVQVEQSFKIPREPNGDDIIVIDNNEFQLDTVPLRGYGEVSVDVTFHIAADNNTGTTRYRFFDADVPNKALSATYSGGTINL